MYLFVFIDVWVVFFELINDLGFFGLLSYIGVVKFNLGFWWVYSVGVMFILFVNILGIGNEDYRFNWVLFELLWWDFFRLVFYVFDILLLFVLVF